MGGKKNKKKSKPAQSSSATQDPLQLNSSMINELTANYQLYIKYYQNQLSTLQMNISMTEMFKELEIPQKFKINSEDLEVKVEDFKSLEISQKKVNNKIKASDVLDQLQEERTKLYEKFQPYESQKEFIMNQYIKDQKYLSYAVTNNGMHLWKSLMHERYRWLKIVRIDSEYCINQDADLDRMLKNYFSRKANCLEDKEQKKMLKSIFEKYNSYFKGKTTQQLQFQNGIQTQILHFEINIYAKIIHNLKKILKYLHQRLQQVIVYQQSNQSIIFKPYENNKVFYLNFFNCVMNYYLHAKQKYKDIKPLIDQIKNNSAHYSEFLKQQLSQSENLTQTQNAIFQWHFQFLTKYMQPSSLKSYAILKNLFILFILQDPLINKLILFFKDQIIEDLEPTLLNGELDKDEYQSQCYIENFEDDLINQLRKFRQVINIGNSKNQNGCLQILRQRWVEWYRHLYSLDFFKLHDIAGSQSSNQENLIQQQQQPQQTIQNLKLHQLICDQLENLSQDSDDERDTKYNILDETDMIEEEEEGAEYDDEELEGIDDYGGEIKELSHNNSGEIIDLSDPKVKERIIKEQLLQATQNGNSEIWKQHLSEVLEYIEKPIINNGTILPTQLQQQQQLLQQQQQQLLNNATNNQVKKKRKNKKKKNKQGLQKDKPDGDALMDEENIAAEDNYEQVQQQQQELEDNGEEEKMSDEIIAFEDEFIQQFENKLANANTFAKERKLKPNLNKEWLEKINKTLEISKSNSIDNRDE